MAKNDFLGEKIVFKVCLKFCRFHWENHEKWGPRFSFRVWRKIWHFEFLMIFCSKIVKSKRGSGLVALWFFRQKITFHTTKNFTSENAQDVAESRFMRSRENAQEVEFYRKFFMLRTSRRIDLRGREKMLSA